MEALPQIRAHVQMVAGLLLIFEEEPNLTYGDYHHMWSRSRGPHRSLASFGRVACALLQGLVSDPTHACVKRIALQQMCGVMPPHLRSEQTPPAPAPCMRTTSTASSSYLVLACLFWCTNLPVHGRHMSKSEPGNDGGRQRCWLCQRRQGSCQQICTLDGRSVVLAPETLQIPTRPNRKSHASADPCMIPGAIFTPIPL